MNIAAKKEAEVSGFFTNDIREVDREVFDAIADELHRQQNQIELIVF